MNKRMFTKEQIQALLENENVAKCSEKSITYSPEFKLNAIRQYYDCGLSPVQIFVDAGFDLSMIGKQTPKYCLRDWKRVHRKNGADGLLKERRGRSKGGGRPKTKNLTDQEKIEKLEATVAYLKAENDFLAKLRAAREE